MKVRSLIAQLEAYPGETAVKVFDDWGNAYVLRPISNVLDSSEFENLAENDVAGRPVGEKETPVVVICFDVGGD